MSNACARARDSCSSSLDLVLSFYCFPAFFTLTFGISMEYLVLCLSSFIRCLLYTFSVHLPSSLFTFIPLSFHLLLVIFSPSLSLFLRFHLPSSFDCSLDSYCRRIDMQARGRGSRGVIVRQRKGGKKRKTTTQKTRSKR